jgi:hypothetical protein
VFVKLRGFTTNILNKNDIGSKNTKYTIDRRILKLIHPSSSTNFNHKLVIQLPNKGINKKTRPRIREE